MKLKTKLAIVVVVIIMVAPMIHFLMYVYRKPVILEWEIIQNHVWIIGVVWLIFGGFLVKLIDEAASQAVYGKNYKDEGY